MLRSLYDKTLSWADHPKALWILAIVAFVESSFFPIPPDILLIPLILAAPTRAFKIAAVATVASVLGGMFGYAIGAFAYDTIGEPILVALGKEKYFAEFAQKYNEWGVAVVLFAGMSPFPYKVITILSGATGQPFLVFTLSSIIARGLRFFIVATLLYYFGAAVRDFIEKRLGLVFTLFLIALVGGFYLLRYV